MTRNEIIRSLLDQARDKDHLANGESDGIFAGDATVLREAAAMLEAQEPHLLTLKEIQHTDAVWLETHGWTDGDIHETVLRRRSDFEDYVTEFADNDDGDVCCDNSKIGIEWRCWNKKPTDEQRKAVKWDG